jgi:hypothetical protein
VSEHDRSQLSVVRHAAHKGIVDVLRADRLADDRYRALLFGTRSSRRSKPTSRLERWILALPYQRFDDLPQLVGAGPRLRAPGSEPSGFPLPATGEGHGRAAMGVLCLVRPVPPLQPLIDKDVLLSYDIQRTPHERIASVFEHYDDDRPRAEAARCSRRRSATK